MNRYLYFKKVLYYYFYLLYNRFKFGYIKEGSYDEKNYKKRKDI